MVGEWVIAAQERHQRQVEHAVIGFAAEAELILFAGLPEQLEQVSPVDAIEIVGAGLAGLREAVLQQLARAQLLQIAFERVLNRKRRVFFRLTQGGFDVGELLLQPLLRRLILLLEFVVLRGTLGLGIAFFPAPR